jgi:hypothetical protein
MFNLLQAWGSELLLSFLANQREAGSGTGRQRSLRFMDL